MDRRERALRARRLAGEAERARALDALETVGPGSRRTAVRERPIDGQAASSITLVTPSISDASASVPIVKQGVR